jgi:hypothetical protein
MLREEVDEIFQCACDLHIAFLPRILHPVNDIPLIYLKNVLLTDGELAHIASRASSPSVV